MMTRYMVWLEDHGTEADAVEIAAFTPRTAAEKFCEWYDARACEYPPEREVSVRTPAGAVDVFVVTLSMCPEYSGKRKGN